MPVTLTSTGITFSDGNSQNSQAAGGASTSSEQVFNSSGTWNKPAGCIGAFAIAGGGGGGGGHRGPNQAQTLPGGSGGIAASYLSLSTLTAGSYPVTIGAGGNGQNWFQSSAAPAGGASNFGGFVVGGGGNGGRGAPGTLTPSVGAPGFPNSNFNAGVGMLVNTFEISNSNVSSSPLTNSSTYAGLGGTGTSSTNPGSAGNSGKVRVINVG